ncbi:MAG: S8 family serine peptidase [Propionibacteriales bacterium]|nr:S8 family serine peptidase [Propionibacteriales bacterium]
MVSRRICTAFAAVALVAATPTGASGSEAPPGPATAVSPGLYVVILRDAPIATYAGGMAGYPATRAPAGRHLDLDRPAVRTYRALLLERQHAVLGRLGGPNVRYRYLYALSGFAADLTSEQVKQVRSMPEVVSAELSTVERLDTLPSTSPPGLAIRGQALPGLGRRADAGEGVVVGVVDSGIWPENPSFAGRLAQPDPQGFTGTCEPATDWSPRDCNSKVVSARHFARGFGESNLAQGEFLSPRDSTGHGSHTAAIIAGNHGVDVEVDGEHMGTASGVAPAARLAIYKACWASPDPADDGCSTADTTRAIDQAVADGVDVLSYAISGSRDSVLDPVETAFRNAADAGVFVAASAGNHGSRWRSVAHPSPWVTTVGASVSRGYPGEATYGGESAAGAMASDRTVPRSRLVVAGTAVAPGALSEHSRLCFRGALDAAEVTGAIVVCDRGRIARVEKSRAVALAGGAGMILVNTGREGLRPDLHAVPTVHVTAAAGQRIKRYAADAGDRAWARLSPVTREPALARAPRVAGFSSRGPTTAAGSDLLKPDVTAPGVGVTAAASPQGTPGGIWDNRSGSSVAMAHAAGMAAVLRAEHPGWSPAAVKSALMTTAAASTEPVHPFAEGAGSIDPRPALDPGLVYDSGGVRWRNFLAGLGELGQRAAASDTAKALRAENLNQPAIAVGGFAGRTAVTRAVTNVSRRSETYTASIAGLGRLDVEVEPSALTLASGETARFAVRFAATQRTSYTRYAKGSLTWVGSRGHEVRSQIAVRPLSVDPVTEVAGEGRSGSVELGGRAGLSGTLDMTVSGPVGARPERLTLTPDPMDEAHPTEGPGTRRWLFSVPRGTAAVRFEVAAQNPQDDLDLYVYRDNELVASATSPRSAERITMRAPESGIYSAYANAHSAADDVSSSATFTGWVVPDRDLGHLRPDTEQVDVRGARPFLTTASWSGLDERRRWFGVVGFEDARDITYVSVN